MTLRRSSGVGCTLPASSVARDAILCGPGGRFMVANDHSRHAYLPRDASSVALCQGPSSTFTSTDAIGTGPPHAGPVIRYSQSAPFLRRVTRATSDFIYVFEIDVSSQTGPSGVSTERSDR